MIFKSEHMTQASGSIGGVTYGRAKGGVLYRRARAIPVNPSTTYQQQVRDGLTNAVGYWNNNLTQAQRDAWDLYGQNVPVTNRLGSVVHISGQNWFVGWWTAQQQAISKLSMTSYGSDDAPATFDRGDFTTPGVSSASVAGGLTITFDDTDPWNGSATGNMFIWLGRPRSPARSFFKGPYRLLTYADGVIGGASNPIVVTPANCTANGWTLVLGQRLQCQAAIVYVDGRMTPRRTFGDTIVVA